MSVLFVVQMMVYGTGFYAFTLFMKPLLAEFGWSRAVVSGSVSVFWITAPLLPVIGVAAQRLDGRWLIVAGALLEGICLIAVGGIDSTWQLYALRAIMGFGKVIIAVATPVIVARWFDRLAGIALGVAYCGAYFGGLALSTVTQLLITQLGWRPAAVILGMAVPIVVIVPTIWILRFRQPEELGLKRDGPALGTASLKRDCCSLSTGLTVGEVLRTRTFWVLAGLELIFYSVYASILVQESSYLTDLGFSSQVAANSVGITSAIGIPSVLMFGVAIDRWHPRGVLTSLFSLLMCAVGVLLLLGRHSDLFMLIAFIALFGFACGGIDVAFVNTIRRCFGNRNFGAIYGCFYFVTLVAFVVAPIVAGRAFDVSRTYSSVFEAAGVGIIVGLIALAFARLSTFEDTFPGDKPVQRID